MEQTKAFSELQADLPGRWQRLRDDWTAPADIVVIPSLSLDGIDHVSIPGVNLYEERLLFNLNLLRHPRVRLVYVTAMPVHPSMVDYTLSLVGGIPAAHMRSRLYLVSAYDNSPAPLTQKLLARPRLVQRIAEQIRPEIAHMTCFNVSKLETELAERLQIPIYGCDPALDWLGGKSGSRRLFKEAGIDLCPGAEDLRDKKDVSAAIAQVCAQDKNLRRVAVKLDQGYSGMGNAVVDVTEVCAAADSRERQAAADACLDKLEFVDDSQSTEQFFEDIKAGGIVEAFIESGHEYTPSVQMRMSPSGDLEVLSSHDQMVDGLGAQVYSGCRFPAADEYKREITQDAIKVGRLVGKYGGVGRFGVDFICRPRQDGSWDRYAIEINLRFGGTTHPMMLMKMMTDGQYDAALGLYKTKGGAPQFYVATDSFCHESLKGLLVDDLLDIAAMNDLHYDPWIETGSIFHLTGTLSEYGKLGFTAIGSSREKAMQCFERTKKVLSEQSP